VSQRDSWSPKVRWGYLEPYGTHPSVTGPNETKRPPMSALLPWLPVALTVPSLTFAAYNILVD
jgi:hypothetical protein